MGSRHGVCEGFLILRIMHLKFQNKGILLKILRLDHHIIPAETALPVGGNHILSGKVNHQPQNETVIKVLRFLFLRRTGAGVKITEGL